MRWNKITAKAYQMIIILLFDHYDFNKDLEHKERGLFDSWVTKHEFNLTNCKMKAILWL